MAQSKEELDFAIRLELEEEERRHKDIVAAVAITAKKHKRKAEEISKDKCIFGDKVSEDIEWEDGSAKEKLKTEEKGPALEEDTNDEKQCGDCGRKAKEKGWDNDNWHFCERCPNLMCQDCVIECVDCREKYCKCVMEEAKYCEDCECGGTHRLGMCCASIAKAPCGRRVCDECINEFHSSHECNGCCQARERRRRY